MLELGQFVFLNKHTCLISFPVFRCDSYLFGSTIYLPPGERAMSSSGRLIFRCSAEKLPSMTILLVYNHLITISIQVSSRCESYIPFWVLIPLFRKINTRLRTGRTENCKTSRLRFCLFFMTQSRTYPGHQVSPHS